MYSQYIGYIFLGLDPSGPDIGDIAMTTRV